MTHVNLCIVFQRWRRRITVICRWKLVGLEQGKERPSEVYGTSLALNWLKDWLETSSTPQLSNDEMGEITSLLVPQDSVVLVYTITGIYRNVFTCSHKKLILRIFKLKKQRGHELETEKRGIWEGFQDGKMQRKWCNYSIISKNDDN